MRIAVLEARVDASFAPLWLMARKQPGKNCRRAADLPLRRDHGATGTCAIYVVMSVSYANVKAWHGARIGTSGPLSWEWQGSDSSRPRGEQRMSGVISARMFGTACAALLTLVSMSYYLKLALAPRPAGDRRRLDRRGIDP